MSNYNKDDLPSNRYYKSTSQPTVNSQLNEIKNQRCQKCNGYGHWSYECKKEQPYLYRPSRTKQLKNPIPLVEESLPQPPTEKITSPNKEIAKESTIKKRESSDSRFKKRTRSQSSSSGSSSESNSDSGSSSGSFSDTSTDSSSSESSNSRNRRKYRKYRSRNQSHSPDLRERDLSRSKRGTYSK